MNVLARPLTFRDIPNISVINKRENGKSVLPQKAAAIWLLSHLVTRPFSSFTAKSSSSCKTYLLTLFFFRSFSSAHAPPPPLERPQRSGRPPQAQGSFFGRLRIGYRQCHANAGRPFQDGSSQTRTGTDLAAQCEVFGADPAHCDGAVFLVDVSGGLKKKKINKL